MFSIVTQNLQQALVNASVRDIAILEYRDTIGGRAWHKPFGEDKNGKPSILEMGANWVWTSEQHSKSSQPDNYRFKGLDFQEEYRTQFGSWYVENPFDST